MDSENSENSVKTTVRLPSGLYWRFQNERVRRALSNQKAVQEAFLTWINSPRKPSARRKSRSGGSQTAIGEIEPVAIETLRSVLRSGDEVRIAVITAVLEAVSDGSGRGK
jgi:hypothetical protein